MIARAPNAVASISAWQTSARVVCSVCLRDQPAQHQINEHVAVAVVPVQRQQAVFPGHLSRGLGCELRVECCLPRQMHSTHHLKMSPMADWPACPSESVDHWLNCCLRWRQDSGRWKCTNCIWSKRRTREHWSRHTRNIDPPRWSWVPTPNWLRPTRTRSARRRERCSPGWTVLPSAKCGSSPAGAPRPKQNDETLRRVGGPLRGLTERSLGVDFLVETHNNSLADDPQNMLRLLDLSGGTTWGSSGNHSTQNLYQSVVNLPSSNHPSGIFTSRTVLLTATSPFWRKARHPGMSSCASSGPGPMRRWSLSPQVSARPKRSTWMPRPRKRERRYDRSDSSSADAADQAGKAGDETRTRDVFLGKEVLYH